MSRLMKRSLFLLTVIAIAAAYFGLRGSDEPRYDSVQLKDHKAAPRAAETPLAPPLPQASKPQSAGLLPAKPKGFNETAVDLGRMSGEQLLSLYKNGLDSDSPQDKFLANQALGLCIHTLYTSQALDSSQMATANQMRIPESMRQMKEKCGPFVAIRLQDALAASKVFSAGIEGKNSPFSSYHVSASASESEKKAFEERLASNITAYGPAALLWDSGNISDWMISQLPNSNSPDGRFASTEEQRIVNGAVSLAMCYAGYDCSSSSLTYLNLCAKSGECESTINDGILRHFSSAEERASVENLASKIGTALMNGDLLSLKGWHVK